MLNCPCKAALESYKMARGIEKRENTNWANFVFPAEVNQIFHAVDNL